MSGRCAVLCSATSSCRCRTTAAGTPCCTALRRWGWSRRAYSLSLQHMLSKSAQGGYIKMACAHQLSAVPHCLPVCTAAQGSGDWRQPVAADSADSRAQRRPLLTFVQQLAARVLRAGAAGGRQAGKASTPAWQEQQRPRRQPAANVEEVALELLLLQSARRRCRRCRPGLPRCTPRCCQRCVGEEGGKGRGKRSGFTVQPARVVGSASAAHGAATDQPNQLPFCCLCPLRAPDYCCCRRLRRRRASREPPRRRSMEQAGVG